MDNWNPKQSRNINNPDILALLDSKTSSKIAKDVHLPNYTNKRTGAKPTVGKAADSDLLSSMASKLSSQQKLNNSLKKEIQEKTGIIHSLKEEIKVLKLASSEEAAAEIRDLQSGNSQLRAQLSEMEDFLNDYGLKWVGKEGKLDVKSIQEAIGGSEPRFRCNLPREIDVRVLERRIHELNMIAESDAIRMVSEGGIHRFKAPPSIAIVFFKNGVVLHGFPFRPYSSHEAQSILSDILDGFFPYDLKRKYPDGVPLKVVDRTERVFTVQEGVSGLDDPDLGFLSKEEFLDQLPSNVIKGGEVVPVRDEVARAFGGVGNITVKTHVDVHIEKTPEDDVESLFTTIRIKTETGKMNVIFKMWRSDRISDILQYIEKHRETKKKYEIRSTFPARVYDLTATDTLAELEMVPSFTLALKLVD